MSRSARRRPCLITASPERRRYSWWSPLRLMGVPEFHRRRRENHATNMKVATRTPVGLWHTSVGKKAVMAVTGVILLLFVVAHMIGNLKAFTGERHFDAYSAFLRRIGDPILGNSWYLWIQRVGLVAAVVLHMLAAYQLTVA